jgi:hypothetical protein
MMSSVDIEESVRRYSAALSAQDYEGAKVIARNSVVDLKQFLEDENNDEESLKYTFHLSVFFRGLYDFATLNQLVSEKWFQNQKMVETVWCKLWDCKERIGFARCAVGGTAIDGILNWLAEIEEFFLAQFGPGLYASPVILIERELCIICGQDLQICSHLPGKIYRGRLCAASPVIRDLRSVDFVQAPRDYRCRVWPWQREGNVIKGICFMHVFSLDDFRQTDEWT